MNPSRILPDLQCSVLCEDVRREINGSFSLIGVVSFLPAQQFPMGIWKLCVFNRWTAGVGRFKEKVRFLAPDSETLMGESELGFELKEPGHTATTVSMFTQMQIPQPGLYQIEVTVEEVLKLRYPVPVLQVTNQQAPPQAPPAEPPPPQPTAGS